MSDEIATFLTTTDHRRRVTAAGLQPATQALLGQYFTPPTVATFLASLFVLTPGPKRLLDPGAGVGSLTAAFVARWAEQCSGPLSITASELDLDLATELKQTIAVLEDLADIQAELHGGDFIEWATEALKRGDQPQYDYIIMNPPYRKLAAKSQERTSLSRVGVEASNLYAAFVGLAIRLLAPGGQLVAITPRSFANGPYFKTFRKDLLSRVTFRRVHVYESRNKAFAEDDVLQENVIFAVENTTRLGNLVISASPSPASEATISRVVDYDDFVVPSDPEQFIHLTPDESHVADLRLFAALPETLATLPMSVSTGRVVDFRTRDNLVRSPEDGTVPLIYPTHMQDGRLSWPRDGKKPNALRLNADTVSLLLPAGWYVVVKRFSAKEEPRRIVASLVTDQDLPGQQWAFENHLNVYHCGNRTLDPLIAVGLCIWLNSSAVDNAFRQFSGHTQVNATDLRNLRYPSVDTLKALATAAGSSIPDQLTIDSLISGHVWKSMV